MGVPVPAVRGVAGVVVGAAKQGAYEKSCAISRVHRNRDVRSVS